jgi:hypothetical protein
MAATTTLASTTLAVVAQPGDREVNLASTSGVTPGLRLFVGGELMEVVRSGVGNWRVVKRGVDGTEATLHDSSETVYIGRGDEFHTRDPSGAPAEVIAVSPWINVRNGSVWFAQGDALPSPNAKRWWEKQTATHSVGALGVRVETLSPTEST